MTCQENGEWLLLHAHGQLGPLEQMALVPHLLLCADCRNALHSLQATSGLLFRASAVPGDSRRNSVRVGLGLSAGLRAWIALIVIGCLLAVSFLGWHLVHAAAITPAVLHPATTRGCTPGLPSDHCR